MKGVAYIADEMDSERRGARPAAASSELVAQLKNLEDGEVWLEFYNTYSRVFFSAARQAGLSEEESHDIVQETMLTVVRRLPELKYERKKGRFKNWLLTLTRSRIIDHLRRKKTFHTIHTKPGTLTQEQIEAVPNPQAVLPDEAWEREWQANLMEATLAQVKKRVSAKQFQIFHCYVIEDWSVQEVCRTLKVSASSVYVAKHRVGRVFREEMESLRGQPRA